MKTELQVYRDGKLQTRAPLAPGDLGTAQAIGHMRAIVEADARKADVRRFVTQTLLRGVRGHDQQGEVGAIFQWARDGIRYTKDPYNAERIADIWTTLYGPEHEASYEPEGDCGIKVTALCTALACVGYPVKFRSIRQTANDQGDSHVLALVWPLWRPVEWLPLDPTPPARLAGYHPRFLSYRDWEVFA